MRLPPTTDRVQALIVALGLATVMLLLVPYVDLTHGLTHARLNFYSVDDDKRLGKEWAERFQSKNPIVKDPALNVYLQQLGERIAAVAAVPDFQFRFRILNTEAINAQAFPGGFIYVNLGLLLAARNEGELAGVLAHEIGHVVARHGTKQLSQSQLVEGAIAVGGTLVFGPVASPVTGLMTQLGELSYSRWEEQQADDLAVDYLYLAGYHPEGVATFLDLLWQKRHEGPLGELLSTHPLAERRAANARWRFSTWPLDAQWVRDSTDFQGVNGLFRSTAHISRGRRLLQSGKFVEAQDELEKALELNSRSGEAYYWRAAVLAKIGMNDFALRDLKASIEVNPDMIESYEALDALLAPKGEWDTIAAYWTRFIDLHPESGKAYYERGGSYYHKGDMANALKDAKQSCNLGYQSGCQIHQKLTARAR